MGCLGRRSDGGIRKRKRKRMVEEEEKVEAG